MSHLLHNLHLDKNTANYLRMLAANLGGKGGAITHEWKHECDEGDQAGVVKTITLHIGNSDVLQPLLLALQADQPLSPSWKKYTIGIEQDAETGKEIIAIRQRMPEGTKNNGVAAMAKADLCRLLEGVLQRQTISPKIKNALLVRLKTIAAKTGEDTDALAEKIVVISHPGNVEIRLDADSAAFRQLRYELEEAGRDRTQTPIDVLMYGEQKLRTEDGNICDSYYGVADAANKMLRAAGEDPVNLISTPLQPGESGKWVADTRHVPSQPSPLEM